MDCVSSKIGSKKTLMPHSKAPKYAIDDNSSKKTSTPRMITKNRHMRLTLATNKDIKQQTKHQVKQMSHLKLAWQNKTISPDIRSLCQILRSIKFVDKFCLDFQSETIDISQILRTLYSEAKHMRSVSKLELNLFSYVGVFRNHQIERLCLALCRLHGLSVLNLRWWTTVSNKKLDSLASGLRHLRSLVKFHLAIFSWTALDAQDIESLFSSLKHLPLLSVLCLDLDSSIHDDETLESLLSGLKSLKSLSALDLEIYWNRTVCARAIQSFMEGLGSMACITGLNFNFFYYPTSWFGSELAESLCWMLMQLTSLSSLTLKLLFDWRYTDEQTMINLSHAFAKLQALSSLDLSLNTSRVLNIKFLEKLMSALPQQLKSLSLNCSPCFDINDKGMEIFSSYLEKLSSLSQLRLNFDLPSTSSEKGINYLYLALRHLNCLRSLTLTLRGRYNIEFNMAESLFKILAALKCSLYTHVSKKLFN